MALGHSTIPFAPKGWPSDPKNAALSRFAARFRVAKALKNVTFEDPFGRDTGMGYENIVRCFLTYTAYEKFSSAFGLTADHKRKEIEKRYVSSAKESELLAGAVLCRDFLEFLKHEAEGDGPKAALDDALSRKPYSFILVAEAVRHSFSHGSLTPNAWKSNPLAVGNYCNLISALLIDLMDGEATPRWKARYEKKKSRANKAPEPTPTAAA